MKVNEENEKKVCRACKRILDEESKFGMCPTCINKYGTPAAALGVAGLALVGKKVFKNSGKIVKGVFNVIKSIK